jgi:hypothetical protein
MNLLDLSHRQTADANLLVLHIIKHPSSTLDASKLFLDQEINYDGSTTKNCWRLSPFSIPVHSLLRARFQVSYERVAALGEKIHPKTRRGGWNGVWSYGTGRTDSRHFPPEKGEEANAEIDTASNLQIHFTHTAHIHWYTRTPHHHEGSESSMWHP